MSAIQDTTFYDLLGKQVQVAVQQETERQADIAAEATRKAVRAKLGEIALSLFSNYSIQNGRQELVIRVSNEVK